MLGTIKEHSNSAPESSNTTSISFSPPQALTNRPTETPAGDAKLILKS